jgi:hypothetical protein
MLEGLAVAALVFAFPAALLALVMGLDRFESAYVRPEERAASLVELVMSSREPDEVEEAAAELLAPVVPVERVRASR